MNESVRYLLRQGADTVERPQLDVGHLVARAERRMFRRRLAAVAASTVAVTMIAAGGVALRPDERRSAPPPVAPVETPDTTETQEPTPTRGSRIYFAALADSGEALTDPDVEVYPVRLDIYVAREGEPVRRVIATKKNERCPAVSPDGARLAYLEGPAIVVRSLDPAGDPGATELRVDLSHPTCPQWSPDGRRLAVASQGPDAGGELRVVKLDGTERVLVRQGPARVPDFAWTADGETIAYTTQDAVWSAPWGGGAPRLLWRGTATPDPSPYGLPLAGAPTSLAWSSTGEFAVSVFPDSVIHVVDPDSGHDQTLGKIQDSFRAGRGWSPDGSRLAFVGGDGHLRVYDQAKGSTATLRPKQDDMGEFRFYDVAWSPDGDRLLAGATRHPSPSGAGFALVSMEPDGTSVEVLTPWTSALYWTYMDEVSWSPL